MKSSLGCKFFYLSSFFGCTILALNVGCVSGGFQLTRRYATFINSQPTILRVVLFILTIVVFAVTLLIDAVVFNTMDFWEGKVSAGTYDFKDGERTFQVRHEILPFTKLKRSTIQITNSVDHALLHEVVLNETPPREIEMFVDGKLRTRVSNISAIPVASTFDESGQWVEDKALWQLMTAPTAQAVAGH